MKTAALFVTLGALATWGCSSDGSGPFVSGGQPIIEGVVDTEYDAVLGAGHRVGQGMFCGATLITPDLALTAHHCTVDPAELPGTRCAGGLMPSSLSASQLLAVADDNITASSTSLRVAEIHNLPDHATRELCGNDIAVIQLSNALNDITPIALDLETVPELDQSLTLVGYGVFDLADTSAFGPRHRREEALVDHVGAEGEYMVDGEFSVDRGPCAGDSGSPALSDADAVVGVMSRGNQTSCTHMVYERIDTHAAWLKDLARQSASRLGIAPPEWAEEPSVEEPDPEDGSDDGDEPADGDDDAGDTGDSGDTGDTGNAGDNSSVAAGSGAGDGECSIGSSKQRAPLAAMAWLLCGLLLRRRFARDRA